MNDLDRLRAAGGARTVGEIIEQPGNSAGAAPGSGTPPAESGDLVLVFDTETTGLPNWGAPSDHPDQPHIVSLAAELCTPDGEVVETYSQIVNVGVPIPADTVAIHGITDEIAKAQGIPPTDMLAAFFALVDRASLVVAYNASFDIRMVRIQAARHLGQKWDCPKPKDDPMWIVTKELNVKKPKLVDAMHMVFGERLDGAHNAMVDCTAARRIYFEMVKRGYVAENPRAVAGGNSPPADEPTTPLQPKTTGTPLELHTANINDLYEEAHNWLDGSPIENQEQADEVTRLLDMARKAGKAADTQRDAEKRPHDEASKAVQAVWKPLVDKAKRIETGTKAAIGNWMLRQQAEQRAAAEKARKEAEEKAAAALAEHRAAAESGNLAAIEDAEQSLKDAKTASQDAARAEKEKPAAKVEGMARGLGLRTVYEVELADHDTAAQELARHFWQNNRREVVDFYMELARKAVSAGARTIPGTTITSRQVAR